MAVDVVFETHSTSEDNERGIATGWLPGSLSLRGQEQARQMGRRRRDDGLWAVFASDLGRAVETAELAFAGSSVPVLLDWRLRECDYGRLNGTPTNKVHGRRQRYLRFPYPEGESWEQAVARVGRFLEDLPSRWSGGRVLVIGHLATRWALEHIVNGASLDDLVDADFVWREGWEYQFRPQ